MKGSALDLQAIAFYVLSAVTIGSALMVVTARNPVHSVLFLITTFFTCAGLFVLLGAEFLAMLLVVVYVGAVAVLFLFVVMMLDVDFGSLRSGFARYLPIGGVVAAVLLGEMILVASAVGDRGAAVTTHYAVSPFSNTEQIGRVLYTDYIYFFEAAGMVLLVAMIGAIVLTLRHKPGIKRQVIADQTARTAANGMRIITDVKIGQGTRCMSVGLNPYLAVAAILFTIGVFGIFVNRRNIIIIMMAIELILLAVNINLVAFSSFLHEVTGQIFAMFVLTVAAAEAAVGLAILVTFFRNRGDILVDRANMMKG